MQLPKRYQRIPPCARLRTGREDSSDLPAASRNRRPGIAAHRQSPAQAVPGASARDDGSGQTVERGARGGGDRRVRNGKDADFARCCSRPQRPKAVHRPWPWSRLSWLRSGRERRLVTLPRVRVFFIDGLRTPTSSAAHAGVNEVRLRHGRIVREGLRTTLTELRQRKTSRTARARWDSICGLPALFIVGRDRGKAQLFLAARLCLCPVRPLPRERGER